MIDVQTGPINTTAGTGVPFLGPYSDHYLHFESSNLPWNSTAALFSPVYDKILGQNGCLSLQFSMNGANMGSLSLYLMPENDSNFTAKVNYTANFYPMRTMCRVKKTCMNCNGHQCFESTVFKTPYAFHYNPRLLYSLYPF